ncbi:TQO small subunit DoxD [Peredibacter sp. HCB2-198]|uniref:TQO small subunit DoxD n=1 Tax=Peredibacter sp. HCB2-198 TaxID=3383025 RepID=UPI0038B42B27
MNYSLALRLVVGWTYFSAFWRRLVLENKLDPEAVGYIGEKFNHFFPNALLIKGPIEYLLTHPDLLWWTMTVFTIVEGVIGLLLMLGLFTRLTSLGVIGLALGILLSAGWLGTTCLDEWQIGILGMAGGLSLFFTGGGEYSLDHALKLKKLDLSFLTSYFRPKLIITSSLIVFFISLATNQAFHGGVWGKLHNKSVNPKLEITNLAYANDVITFDLMRTEGVDVYGSFVYRLEVLDLSQKEPLYKIEGEQWKDSKIQIQNKYIAKIKQDKFSLLAPLGAKAQISLKLDKKISNEYSLRLTDINGTSWSLGSIDMKIKNDISLQQRLKSDSVFIIDVREKDEFDKGHISGAELMPVGSLENDFEGIPSDKKILIYCQSGIRAQRAIEILKKKGIPAENIGGYPHLKELKI